MFKGFTRQPGFNGFAKNIRGPFQSDWNGYPCIFWLDAAELVSYVNVSGVNRIDSWTDRIAGIRHQYGVGVANRGTFNLSDANLNGFPSCQALNSESFKAVQGRGTTLQLGLGYTMVSVHSLSAIAPRNDLCCQTPFFAPNIALAGTRVQWNGIGYGNGDTVFMGTNYETMAPTIAVFTVDRIVLNRVEQPITVGSAPAPQGAWGKFDTIGAGGAGANVMMGEILCFPFQASLAEAQAISDLLNAKYAIY
jgi:hypothetical protein